MEEILVEKYRPQQFADVIGLNPEIPKLTESGNIPHMLFTGPPGTGKTTVAKIIAKNLNADVLLLNASKDRGIDTIRERIEPFATKASDRIKIVFLDEMDATTPAFQTALRNFMETHARSTRFIATCNYPEKIIPPLRSRFSEFKFQNYDENSKKAHVAKIARQENIQIDEGAVLAIVAKYHDDVRSMVNFLNQKKGKAITKEDISQERTVLSILSKLADKKWLELRTELLSENLDYNALIEEMDAIIFRHPSLPITTKQKANKLFADYQFKMYFSFNKELCFAALLAELQEMF